MQKYVMLGLLGLCSWEDIRKKEIAVVPVLLFGVLGVLLHLAFPEFSAYSMLAGILPGIAAMALSYASRGSIGMGDGILLAVTGVYLGGAGNLQLLFTALVLAACWSLGMLLLKKKKGKDEIAFVPFLLASYVTMMVG